MRDHSNHTELPREEAVALLLQHAGFQVSADEEIPQDRCEVIPVQDSCGRVLARDVVSQAEMPNTPTCMLDSIAVHWEDFSDGIMPDTSAWVRGVDWQFANTGIAMPDGFDTAIVIEHVVVSDDGEHVQLNAMPSKQFAGTNPCGSRCAFGQVIAHAGEVITPDVAARIAGTNALFVTVVRKPHVVFIPTGNELVPLGMGRVLPGKNLETNSLLISKKIEAWGATCTVLPILPDTRDALEQALKYAASLGDIVVLNAGSSKGSDDWSVEVIQELGEVLYHQVNHGPGHHCFAGVVDGKDIIGISGPPGGASFCAEFYIRPVLMSFLGLSSEPKFISAKLTGEFTPHIHKGNGPLPGESRPSEVHPNGTFTSVKAVNIHLGPDGVVYADPVKGKIGSAATQHANGMFMMGSGDNDTGPCAGDIIQVELREPTLLSTTRNR